MPESPSRAGNVLVAIAVLCAVAMTGITVRREFFTAPAGADTKPIKLKEAEWAAARLGGRRFGPDTAAVEIVVFSDFQCPSCRNFATRTWAGIRAKYPGDVALVFRHWPLEYHKLALPAARAAECAGRQGKFEEFHDVVFRLQDSLGAKSFASFAVEAEVPDTAAFNRCAAELLPLANVGADIKFVTALGGTGTPTVLINGERFPGAPDSAKADEYVRKQLHAVGKLR